MPWLTKLINIGIFVYCSTKFFFFFNYILITEKPFHIKKLVLTFFFYLTMLVIFN